ncbi:hypothetical protein L2E82_30730 [Cichorium intybus]|uniref:Uncharacterized protein n=1 Tax=Cichorium intybus TaxID=13427 RepID=A0ACB9D131_CICIN|nr:hypothetical protein L2E82_30730 [Cichorium intybus]
MCGVGVAVIGAVGGSRKSQTGRSKRNRNQMRRKEGGEREPDVVEADFPAIKTSRGWKNEPCMWSVKFADDLALTCEKRFEASDSPSPDFRWCICLCSPMHVTQMSGC